MAGVIVIEKSIPANTTDPNVYAGSQFSQLGAPSLLSIAAAGHATGLIVSLNVGNRIICEPSAPVIKTSMPTVPDEFYFNAGGLPGEIVQCRVQNTTGNPIVFRSICQIADA